jgi:HAD superfamily hydrolase (TIGR01549 family)
MKQNLQEYLKSRNKTHLVFDFDETIVRLLLPWGNAFDPIKKELCLLNKEIYENFKKRLTSTGQLKNDYALKFGDDTRRLILKTQTEFEERSLKGYERNDSVINFIRNDKERRMFVWSSNGKQIIEKILKELKILDKFQVIVGNEDVFLLKPFDDGFKKIYEEKIPKDDYLFIGDSKGDMEAASNAGIDFYLVDYFNVPGKFW